MHWWANSLFMAFLAVLSEFAVTSLKMLADCALCKHLCWPEWHHLSLNRKYSSWTTDKLSSEIWYLLLQVWVWPLTNLALMTMTWNVKCLAGQIRGQVLCRAWNALPNNIEHKVEAIMEPFRWQRVLWSSYQRYKLSVGQPVGLVSPNF